MTASTSCAEPELCSQSAVLRTAVALAGTNWRARQATMADLDRTLDAYMRHLRGAHNVEYPQPAMPVRC